MLVDMEESTSREKVLKNIRNALINVADNPFPRVDFNAPVYQPMEEALDITFAQEFTRAGGQFIFCEDEKEFVRNLELLANQNAWDDISCADDTLNKLLSDSNLKLNKGGEQILQTRISLTTCEYLVARPGSIMVSSRNAGGRRMNVFPDIHVVAAYTNQLVPDIKQAFAHITNKYGKKLPSLITLITGPSRTADIEKTLVMGAHGPRELYLFLIDVVQQ